MFIQYDDPDPFLDTPQHVFLWAPLQFETTDGFLFLLKQAAEYCPDGPLQGSGGPKALRVTSPNLQADRNIHSRSSHVLLNSPHNLTKCKLGF